MHKTTKNLKFKLNEFACLHPVAQSVSTDYSRSLFKLWLLKYELSHKMSSSVSSRTFVTKHLLNDDNQIFNNFIDIHPYKLPI